MPKGEPTRTFRFDPANYASKMARMVSPPAGLRQAVRNPRQLAQRATKDPRWLEKLTSGLDADEARVKFGCAKALRFMGEERPELLYPRFDFFVRLLDHPNKILQWEAMFVLSQLARVDRDGKFGAIFD